MDPSLEEKEAPLPLCQGKHNSRSVKDWVTQKSPAPAVLVASLEPFSSVNPGASKSKQGRVQPCYLCCYRAKPTNHEQHRALVGL
jgi:hypothetical protein